MKEDKNRVCPVELAGSLDSKLRRWIQNPHKILAPYVKEGMKVLDVGCGPGYFSIEMAMMVGNSGKVIAADLQEGMLQKVKAKIQNTILEKIITLVKCNKDKINVTEEVDFILCFYMVHEVPDKERFFRELKDILNKEGSILIVEPSFHVTQQDFDATVKIINSLGFKTKQWKKLFLGRTALLTL